MTKKPRRVETVTVRMPHQKKPRLSRLGVRGLVLLLVPATFASIVLMFVGYYLLAVHAERIRDVTTEAACQVSGCGPGGLALSGLLIYVSPYLCAALLIRFWSRLAVVFRVLLVIGAGALSVVALPWAPFMGLGEWSQVVAGELAEPFAKGALAGLLWWIIVLAAWWPIAGLGSLSGPISADFTGKFTRARRRTLILSHAVPLALTAILALFLV